MAIDRGGLDYPIKVRDQFSSNTKKFRAEVAAARREWAKFRAELAKPAGTRATSEAAKVRREVQKASREQRNIVRRGKLNTKEQIKLQKRLAQEAKRQQTVERESTKLRKSVERDQAKQARVKAAAARATAKAEKESARQSALVERNRLKALDQRIKKQRAVEQESIKLRRALATDLARQARVEAAAATQRAAATRRAVRNDAVQRRALERSVAARVRANRATTRGIRAQRSMTTRVKDTESAVNRVSFTFRRLFGILAAFTAARAGAQGFVNLIKTSINFNRSVEDSIISIGALITATGVVTDSQGKALQGAEKFTAAMVEGARQTRLLRQDALQTTATFTELAKAFQAGVGPGLEAGLDLDQVREITIRVSQAAGALGLQQNQLIEEIRSLLRGTIQKRTTLVASVLGIDNKDIANAKQAGNLFEFLQGRLIAFQFAAAETQNTVTGLGARIKDAFSFTVGLAGLEFFETLKVLLKDVFASLVNIQRNAKGVINNITPKPEVVAAFKKLFDGLSAVLVGFKEGLRGLNFAPLTEALGNIFKGIASIDVGKVINDVVRLGAVLLEVVAAAISSSVLIVRALLPFAKVLTAFAPILTIFIQIRVLLTGIRFLSKEIVALFALMPIHLTKTAAAAAAVKTQMTLAQRAGRVLGLAIGATALLAKPLLAAFAGINVSMGTAINLMLSSFSDAMDGLITRAIILAAKVKNILGLDDAVIEKKGYVKAGAEAAQRFSAAFLAGVGSLISKKFGDSVRSHIADALLEDDVIREQAGTLNELAETTARLQADRDKRRLEFENAVADATDRETDRLAQQKVEAKELADMLEKIKKQFTVTGTQTADPATPAEELGLLKQLTQIDNAHFLVEIEKEILQLKKEGVSQDTINLRQARMKLVALKEQFSNEKAILTAKIVQQKAVLKSVEGTTREGFEQTKLNVLLEERNNLLDSQTLKIQQQELAMQRLALIAEGSLFDGLGAGLRGFAEEFKSSFLAGVRIIKGFVTELSSFISDSIVDAFDPTSDTTLLERFADFLQSVARLIIEQLVQIAIAKAVLGLGIGSGFANLGFAEGGEVPDKKARVAPPKGVSKKDTVNAWLQPGEFVQKFTAVRKYGADLMEAINKGLIDPIALRALAFGNKGRRKAVLAHAGAGYAEGGVISRINQTAAEATPASSKDTQAVALFFGQQQMERALAGGAGVSLKRWMRDNQEEFSGLFNSNRR